MKRYESMGLDVNGLMDVLSFDPCYKCLLFTEEDCKLDKKGDGSCIVKKYNWLNQDIKHEPRFMHLKSVKDLAQARKDLYKACDGRSCQNCNYLGESGMHDCFYEYLMEEIDVIC